MSLEKNNNLSNKRTYSNVENFDAKLLIKKFAEKLLENFSLSSDAVIINTYLPKPEALKLQLRLRQIPQLWRSPNLETTDVNDELRHTLKMPSQNYHGFEKFIRSELLEIIPICYLEGYNQLDQQSNGLPWPKKPKFIFSSNSFDTDEIFKAWTAKKVSEGTPYFTGQHGNNYGTSKYCYSETECVSTSDKFITWGWTDGEKKHWPSFIFKSRALKKKLSKEGGVVLIQTCIPHRLGTWDTDAEFKIYQEELLLFVQQLHEPIRQSLLVRLHSEYKKHDWSDNLRWSDYISDIQIDHGSARIDRLVSRNRLVVHSYDSTGILETLCNNIPTLAFWQNGLEHLRDSAKPYYQRLVDAGIVHFTPESAAQKINQVWDEVDSWWKSKEVQYARQSFCDRFAKVENRPARAMKEILLSAISERD